MRVSNNRLWRFTFSQPKSFVRVKNRIRRFFSIFDSDNIPVFDANGVSANIDRFLGMYKDGKSYFTVDTTSIGSRIDRLFGLNKAVHHNIDTDIPDFTKPFMSVVNALLLGITTINFLDAFKCHVSEFMPKRIQRIDFPEEHLNNVAQGASNFIHGLYEVFNKICSLNTATVTRVALSNETSITAPLQGKMVITSMFGTRNLQGSKDEHFGVDFGVPENTPVFATESGKVTYAGQAKGAGNMVQIDSTRSDGTTVRVRFMHLNKCQVAVGDIVKPGQQIALSGNTGKSTGAHLHMDVQVTQNGKTYFIDPVSYLGSTNMERTDANVRAYGGPKIPKAADFMYAKDKKTKVPVLSLHVKVEANPYIAELPNNNKTESNMEKFRTGSGDGVPIDGTVVGTGSNKRFQMKGISYKYYESGGRDERYHNPMNVKGIGYEGQVGSDEWYMVNVMGGAYVNSARWHAAFSDPFYSIKAAVHDKSLCVNWDASRFNADDLKKLQKGKYWPPTYGFPEPKSGRNLYMMCCKYSPISYNKYGPTKGYNSYPGHCGPLARAQAIVKEDPGAFPQGVDTVYDFSKNKRQFTAFIKVTLRSEQGVLVDDWYLSACWDAIFAGGPAPLQENIQNSNSIIETTSMSSRVNYSGFNVKNAVRGNHQ